MNNRLSALMMTFLMLLSLSLAGVTAAIPNADGNNGPIIDGAPEQDATNAARTYDAASVQSNLELTFDSGLVRTDALATTGTGLFAEDGATWTVITGSTSAGDSAVYQLPTDASTATDTSKSGQEIAIIGTEPTDLVMMAPSGDQVKVTFQNWYGSLDRTTPHGQGTSINNAATSPGGCGVIATTIILKCSLNGDWDAEPSTAADGIDDLLPTTVLIRPADTGGSPTYGYAIEAGPATGAYYFGMDYTVLYNVTVMVNGVAQEDGNSLNLLTTDSVILRCADANCTEEDVEITVPTAYDPTGFNPANGLAGDNVIYDSKARMSIYSNRIAKLTFGIAANNVSNASTSGVLWDPSVSILSDEPGLKMGKIHDGEMSWCDAQWFLAHCSGSESFDGNSTDGVDGMIMKITLPLETFWSMSAWGGFDKTTLKVNHPAANSCFNGQVKTYILSESDFNGIVSKNSAVKYAATGNYYSVGSLGTASSAMTLGSNVADYCTGSTSTIVTTEISLNALADITSDPLLLSANNGLYDIENRVFEFYIVVSPEVGTMNAGTPSFNVKMDGAGNSPTLVFAHSTNQDPLALQSGITRTTDPATGQTNPSFASPYVMHYSGITPSDNMIQGRPLSEVDINAGDWGAEYLGSQNGPFDERITRQFAPNATTPYSTVECGAATADGDYVESSIAIFTNLDTSGNTGNAANPSNESEWKAYGVLNTNNSLWTMGPITGTNTGNMSVDNVETATGSSAVTFTGVFINGDQYKAVCTFKISSYDVQAENATTQTITYTTYFSAAEDGNYSSGGGSDVSEDDGWFEQLDGWDFLIIAIALAVIGLALFMYSNGGMFEGWFDDRLAMVLFGVGLLHAWASHHYYYDVIDPIGKETALILGSMGYVVMGLAIYLYGGGRTTMPMRNMRYLAGGLFLIATGVPTALTGIFNVEADVLVDVVWGFPVYDVIAGVGSFIGVVLLSISSAALFRREGV